MSVNGLGSELQDLTDRKHGNHSERRCRLQYTARFTNYSNHQPAWHLHVTTTVLLQTTRQATS